MTMLSDGRLKVQHWPIERLAPYPTNPRKNDHAVERMADAIREFGFRIPVVAKSDGEVVDGHLRLKAAVALGMKNIPVALADNLTDAQVRAFRLLANRSATWAEWDFDLLEAELQQLKIENFDLSLTGFDDNELAKMLAPEGNTDPDDAPDVEATVISKPGDLWLLGRHRLLCGDCTDAATVARALGATKPHLMVTDPPYGVAYDATWRGKAGHATLGKNRTGKVVSDDRADWRDAWALFPGNIAYVWHGGLHSSVVAESLAAAGLDIRSQIIWVKTVMAMGRGDYHWQHEPCWYAVRGTGMWMGDRKQTTVWQISSPLHIMSGSKEEKTDHPTQKPAECMRRPIENNSRAGDAVYDPFVGSGTTIIAAEMTGRSCIALEIAGQYCDVSVRRWQSFSGQAATLDGDGRTFAEIERERSP